MYTLIDGKKTASELKTEIAQEVTSLVRSGHRPPHLAAVLVGHNPSSVTYVNNKVKDCAEVGFKSTLLQLDENIDENELLSKIKELNEDSNIDAFIVQLPLPAHISEIRVTEAIDPSKDADGFHPVNIGRMVAGISGFLPATPFGVVELLDKYGISVSGKHCVIIGRSNIVGRPLSILLSQKGRDATVTLVHSRTRNIPELVKSADIVIAALGSPGFVKAEMIRDGAVVIDIGTTRVESPSSIKGWKLVGDVDFENVAPKCSFITPVPGGVGPMTRVALLQNTLLAARKRMQ